MSLEAWKAFFELGGVVLLLLTFAFGAGALFVNNRLNAIQARELGDFRIKFEEEQQKTALAQKEAAEAKQMAGGFEIAISTANRGAAEANAKAEGFRFEIAKANAQAEAARLELAKFKAPRILTPEQQEHIRLMLAGTSGEKFAVYGVFEPEPIGLANAIGRALFGAGWIVQTPDSDTVVGNLGNAIATGVSIEIAPSHTLSLKPIAMRLAEALISEGIPCTVVEVPTREKNPEWMHVVVGTKPME